MAGFSARILSRHAVVLRTHIGLVRSNDADDELGGPAAGGTRHRLGLQGDDRPVPLALAFHHHEALTVAASRAAGVGG